MGFEVIAFDFMGVVFTKSHVNKNYLLPILRNFNEPLTYEKVHKEYSKFAVDEITESKFWRNLDIKDYEKIRELLIQELLLKIDPSFEQLQLNLKGKIKFAVLSHFPKPWADELLNSSELRETFEFLVITGEQKIKKTNPKIYDILIEKCGCAPEKILFIDDKIRNLKLAKEKGITTALMLRNPMESSDFIPDYILSDLLQIEDLLIDQKTLNI